MRSTPHVQWLAEQLPELVERGVLTPEAADRLATHYHRPAERAASHALVLFGVLGALLVGGGIILVLAHNWPHLTRPLRVGLSLAPTLLAAGFAAWVAARPGRDGWREAAAALWSVALLSSLALVAQTYQLGGEWTDLVLLWLLLALPLVYLLGAASAAALYLGGAVVWTVGSGEGDGVAFWPLALLVVPYLFQVGRRQPEHPATRLLGWAVAVSFVVACLPAMPHLVAGRHNLALPLAASFALAQLLIGSAILAPAFRRPLRTVGGAGLLLAALIGSYTSMWEGAEDGLSAVGWRGETVAEAAIATAVVALGLALWARRLATGERAAGRGEEVLAVAGLVAFWAAEALAVTAAPELAMVTINLYLLAVGVAGLATGLHHDSLRFANFGLAVLAGQLLARFFDADIDFLIRGLAFIAVGLAFFLVNLVLLRRRHRLAGIETVGG